MTTRTKHLTSVFWARASYQKLTRKDVLRWKDEYKSPFGWWLLVPNHLIGKHPSPGTQYRRPVLVVLKKG